MLRSQMKLLATFPSLLAVAAVVADHVAALLYGPGDCVSLERSLGGSCVIVTECEGQDLSQFEFAFDCESNDGDILRHSFGRGGFDPSEDFDTRVECRRCLLPTMSLGPLVSAEPAEPVALVASRSFMNTEGTHQTVVQRKTTKLQAKMQASKAMVQNLRGMRLSSKLASVEPIMRYGPHGCVSTYKSKEGHCMMKTQCSGVDIKDYAFGFVCVDEMGSPVRHMFGKNSFEVEESFDTLVACVQCLGLEELPDSIKLIVRVNSLSDEVVNIEAMMNNISSDMELMRKISRDTAISKNAKNTQMAANVSRLMDKIINISHEVGKIKDISNNMDTMKTVARYVNKIKNISRDIEMMHDIHDDVEKLKKMSGEVEEMKTISRGMENLMTISDKVDSISGKVQKMDGKVQNMDGKVEMMQRLNEAVFLANVPDRTWTVGHGALQPFSDPIPTQHNHGDDWRPESPFAHSDIEKMRVDDGGDVGTPATQYGTPQRRPAYVRYQEEQERWGNQEEEGQAEERQYEEHQWHSQHQEKQKWWGPAKHQQRTRYQEEQEYGVPKKKVDIYRPSHNQPHHVEHTQHNQHHEKQEHWMSMEEAKNFEPPQLDHHQRNQHHEEQEDRVPTEHNFNYRPHHLEHQQGNMPQDEQARWGPNEEVTKWITPAEERQTFEQHKGQEYWGPKQDITRWRPHAEEPQDVENWQGPKEEDTNSRPPVEQGWHPNHQHEGKASKHEARNVVHRYDILAGAADQPTYVLSFPDDSFHWDTQKHNEDRLKA